MKLLPYFPNTRRGKFFFYEEEHRTFPQENRLYLTDIKDALQIISIFSNKIRKFKLISWKYNRGSYHIFSKHIVIRTKYSGLVPYGVLIHEIAHSFIPEHNQLFFYKLKELYEKINNFVKINNINLVYEKFVTDKIPTALPKKLYPKFKRIKNWYVVLNKAREGYIYYDENDYLNNKEPYFTFYPSEYNDILLVRVNSETIEDYYDNMRQIYKMLERY